MKNKVIAAVILSTVLVTAQPALADETTTAVDNSPPDWTFPASISLVSDSIFRGQSQTWGKPAFQFFIEADHKSGVYAGFATSNLSDQWLPGANLETDFYGGFRGSLPGTLSVINFDVGGIYYYYPGANWDESGFNPPTCMACNTESSSLNTFEIYGSLSYKWLTVKAGRTLTEYWGWNYNNSGVGIGFANDLNAGVERGGDTTGSYFYEANALYEVFPSWTLSGQVGRQIINDTHGLNITYYKAGLTKSFRDGWSIGAFYSNTNEPDAYKEFLGLRDTTSKSDVARETGYLSISKSF